MRYTARLTFGFFKAILWSGGLGWRFLLLIGLLPGANKEMLEFFGLDKIPPQHFFILAAVFAVFIFAGRIAYLETPRVALRFKQGPPFEMLNTLPSGDNLRRYMLEVTNIGWQDIARCSVEMLELTDEDRNVYAFPPIPLRTEHQGIGNFHLHSGETMMIKVLSLIESRPEQQIEIHYASTQERTPNALPPDRKYVTTIGVFGAGAPMRRRFMFRVENGRLIFSGLRRKLRVFGWCIIAHRYT